MEYQKNAFDALLKCEMIPNEKSCMHVWYVPMQEKSVSDLFENCAICPQYNALPSFFYGIIVRIHLQFAELFQSYLFPTLFYHSDSSDVNVFHMQMEYAHEKI